MDNTDRLLNKIISVLLFTVLIIMLTIGSIFIMPPSFADSADSVVPSSVATSVPALVGYDSEIQNNTVSTSIVRNNGVIFINNSEGRTKYYIASSVENTFAFCAPSSRPIVYACSTEPDGIVYDCNNYGSTVARAYMSYDETSGLYYAELPIYVYNITIDEPYYSQLPMYDTVTDGLSAIRTYIDNSGTFSAERTITIQPGYVAYIETDGGTLDVIAQFPMLSRLSRPLWDNSVQIAFGVYAPAPGNSFTFTNNFGSSIDWLIPASAPTNLLGQSKVGGRQYTAGLPDNGSSVAIYNPAFSGLSSNSNDYGRAIKAPVLTVTISNCVFVEWFKLRTDATISVQSGPAIVANSDDNYTSSVIYMPDEGETDTVVTDADCYNYNGTTSTTSAGVTMNAGGSNYGTDDIVESADNFLGNLEQKIFNLLSAPITHITNLINNATAFFAEIIHFFDWLPPEVRSVIVSCLALIPVIGFIKLLF